MENVSRTTQRTLIQPKQSECFLFCDHVFIYFCLLNICGKINSHTSLCLYFTIDWELCVGSLNKKICFLLGRTSEISRLESSKAQKYQGREYIFRKVFDVFLLISSFQRGLTYTMRTSCLHAKLESSSLQTAAVCLTFTFI
ncbi:hypothetical protein ATANTOWER_025752 [Ataeniobius toweri]|uniref:Uncharacterized protein n=1 Tax=Ataeniobius toweri TaxID=208326 RepID=A0ABU7BV22_9TELE|nr:hypothetical protein [Ataeniobius toweri]